MHTDAVLVRLELPIAELAERMLAARTRRAVVVDDQFHPIEIVSSTDILAADAFNGGTSEVFDDEIRCPD